MVKDAIKKRDFSEDATILTKASAVVRRDILKKKASTFLAILLRVVKKRLLQQV